MNTYWLCIDCKTYVEDDELPEERDREVHVLDGVDSLGDLVVDHDGADDEGYREESSKPCEACDLRTPGERWRFREDDDDTDYDEE